MTKWNNVSLGELLTESNIPSENPDPSKRITVRLNVEGIEKRPFREETKGATKYYIRKAGQFIYGKQSLHKGAFGIIPEELDGYESTIDLPAFDIDKSKVLPEWLMLILTKDNFYKELESIASGSVTKRIHPERLFQVKIPLPSISEQKDILKKYDMYKVYHTAISNIIDDARIYIDKLRQSILQEAVQGKLVPQDPNDEPASVLLEKIKEEKERLIKEGKIKKEKPLPPISEDEIPYELPKIWEWTRIGNLITLRGGKRIPKGYQLKVDPTEHIYIRITDMKEGTIVDTDLRYIDDYVYEQIKNYIITKQDLYITIAGTIGQVGIVPDKFHNMNLTENAARITPHLVDKIWLKYFLSSPIIQSMLLDKTNQMAQPKLALKRIQDTVIPLPPLNEQKRIVEKVDQLMALCDELEKNIEESKKDSELLMQSVLQEAFKDA